MMLCPRCPSKDPEQVSIDAQLELVAIVYRCGSCRMSWRETTTREVIDAPPVPM